MLRKALLRERASWESEVQLADAGGGWEGEW